MALKVEKRDGKIERYNNIDKAVVENGCLRISWLNEKEHQEDFIFWSRTVSKTVVRDVVIPLGVIEEIRTVES